ncbi:MAG: phosphorylase [Novosphingobium sp.]
MGDVIAVVGLRREAAVLRGLGVRTIAGGGAAQRLADELADLAKDAAGIISFGMAGALAPDLGLGDWVIADRVGDFACDPRWIAALSHRLPNARIGPVHADGRLIADPAEKANLNRASGSLAADMESHIVAAVAASAGLPFAVLRCISDDAGSALPPAIAVAMKPGGGLALGAVFGSLAANPRQIPGLVRTVAGFNRAYRALGAGARQAGQRMAFP